MSIWRQEIADARDQATAFSLAVDTGREARASKLAIKKIKMWSKLIVVATLAGAAADGAAKPAFLQACEDDGDAGCAAKLAAAAAGDDVATVAASA